MTSNQLLLNRLIELMLEHEQHFLPVDVLFEDEKIGDFVKNIQIDSPFQQLLFEGVLTESVKNEKLYVSFTVEGYFHYLLGGVVYNKSKGKNAKYLLDLLKQNKLNGLKDGIKHCLIKDIENNDLSRLIWFIDNGDEFVDICSFPLAFSFHISSGQKKSNEEYLQLLNFQIDKVLSCLFEQPTDNDIDLISKSIEILKELQKSDCVNLLYQQLNQRIEPENLIKSILLVKTIKYLSKNDRKRELDRVVKFTFDEETELASNFLYAIADQFDFVGEYDSAINYYEKSLRIRIKVYGDLHPLVGNVYNNLGSVWKNKGEYNKAIEFYEKSLHINLKFHGVEHSLTGISFNNLASAMRSKGLYDNAIDYFEKSLSINLKLYGQHHSFTATLYNNLGLVWNNKGDLDKGINYYEKSLAIRLKVYGDQHSLTGIVYNNLGSIWNDKGNYDKGIEFYEKSLSIDLLSNGEIHPTTGRSYNNLGSVWRLKGEYDNAIKYSEKSLFVNLKIFGDQHPSTATSYNNLGSIWVDKGEYAKGIECFEKALLIRLKVHDEQHPSVGTTYNNLGNVYKLLMNWNMAREYYQKAFSIFSITLGEHHPHTILLKEKLNSLDDQ